MSMSTDSVAPRTVVTAGGGDDGSIATSQRNNKKSTTYAGLLFPYHGVWWSAKCCVYSFFLVCVASCVQAVKSTSLIVLRPFHMIKTWQLYARNSAV